MKQVQSRAKSPLFGRKQLGGAAKLFRSHEAGSWGFPESQPLNAQYNEMLYTANKIHMIFKVKLC